MSDCLISWRSRCCACVFPGCVSASESFHFLQRYAGCAELAPLHFQWTDSVCSLCACLRLAWRFAQPGSALASLSVPPPLALFATALSCLHSLALLLLLPPFLLYDLQVYFTTWFPQCPPISLGQRSPPQEASTLCSVSPPPLPLPPPKPSNTPLPSQPPRAWRPCPRLCPSRYPRPSTAARSQSCIAPLLPRSPCPLLHPCIASPPRRHPRTLTPQHLLDQTPSTPRVCPSPLSTIREHNHPSPSHPLPLLLLSLLLHPFPLPLSQPPLPPPLVHLQCTTPPVCPLRHRPAVLVVLGACGGLRACMVPTPPPSSPAPDLDRVWG